MGTGEGGWRAASWTYNHMGNKTSIPGILFNVVHNARARIASTLSYFVLLKLFSVSRCVSDTAAVIRRSSTSGDSTTKQAIYCGFPPINTRSDKEKEGVAACN